MAQQVFVLIHYLALAYVRHLACRNALQKKDRISLERIWTAFIAGRWLVMRGTKLGRRFTVPLKTALEIGRIQWILGLPQFRTPYRIHWCRQKKQKNGGT